MAFTLFPSPPPYLCSTKNMHLDPHQDGYFKTLVCLLGLWTSHSLFSLPQHLDFVSCFGLSDTVFILQMKQLSLNQIIRSSGFKLRFDSKPVLLPKPWSAFQDIAGHSLQKISDWQRPLMTGPSQGISSAPCWDAGHRRWLMATLDHNPQGIRDFLGPGILTEILSLAHDGSFVQEGRSVWEDREKSEAPCPIPSLSFPN